MSATKEEIVAFLASEFPQTKCVVEAVDQDGATLSHDIGVGELRPGGTVSGPVMMGLADVALYVAILGKIGIVPLTVTTSLTINFLRKPSAETRIIAKCQLLKIGRSLIVGEVSLYSEGSSDVVAHVVGTYAVPTKSPSALDWFIKIWRMCLSMMLNRIKTTGIKSPMRYK